MTKKPGFFRVNNQLRIIKKLSRKVQLTFSILYILCNIQLHHNFNSLISEVNNVTMSWNIIGCKNYQTVKPSIISPNTRWNDHSSAQLRFWISSAYNSLEFLVRGRPWIMLFQNRQSTLWKGCENVTNAGHSQYWECPSFSQPFHSVNKLLIKGL